METREMLIGNQGVCAFVLLRGGIVSKFIWKDSHIIYPYRIIGEKRRGGIPICFPFFGASKEEFAEEIPQHGWLRNESLECVDFNETHSLSLKGFNMGRESYPWSLKYKVDLSISKARALEIKLQVKRLTDGISNEAPINPAFHPYFNNLGQRSLEIGSEKITDFSSEAKIIPIKNRALKIDLGERKVEMRLGGD
ncbi:MAG: hypothetical protein ACFFDN_30485, partial [Candidatus Hodarchaeota archaeon]